MGVKITIVLSTIARGLPNQQQKKQAVPLLNQFIEKVETIILDTSFFN